MAQFLTATLFICVSPVGSVSLEKPDLQISYTLLTHSKAENVYQTSTYRKDQSIPKEGALDTGLDFLPAQAQGRAPGHGMGSPCFGCIGVVFFLLCCWT